MPQYLSVTSDYSSIYISELIGNGKLLFKKINDFEPEIFVDSVEDDEEGFQTLVGNYPVRRIVKPSISSWRQYKKNMQNVSNMRLYNVIDPEYQYIRQKYSNMDQNQFYHRFWYADIETSVDKKGSFPNPHEADQSITLLQIAESDSDVVYIFSWLQDEVEHAPDVRYVSFETEKQMMEKFIEFYFLRSPSITTAWNGDQFDFPFLVNRCQQLGIDKEVWSPFEIMESHKAVMFGKTVHIDKPVGMPWVDYIEAYRKADPSGRESWSLEYISKYELGDEEGGKLDYKKAGFRDMRAFIMKVYDPNLDQDPNSDLRKAYESGDKQAFEKAWFKVFVEYGAEDVRILKKLDQKLNVLNAIVSLAYSYGCNIYDTFATVKPWQIYLYRESYSRNKKVYQNESEAEIYNFIGGYVFATPGLHSWVISEDYTSLYPFCAMSLNLSPETQIRREDIPADLLSETIDLYEARSVPEEVEVSEDWFGVQTFSSDVVDCVDIYMNWPVEKRDRVSALLKKYNFSMSPNGTFYTREFYGIVPSLVKEVFLGRKSEKGLMKKAENEAERIKKEMETDPSKNTQEYKDLCLMATREAGIRNTNQYVKKIQINAQYGFMGNKVSNIANSDIAGSITSYGRLNVRMTASYVIENINKMHDDFNIYVCQSDTDSFYLSLESVVKVYDKNGERSVAEITEFLDKFIKKYIQPMINESSAMIADWFNAYENSLLMDREIIADVMLSTGKKRYAARIWDNEGTRLTKPKIKIVGLETKRSDVPPSVREKLKGMIDSIFEGHNDKTIEFIDEYRKHFMTLSVDEIGIPTGISDIDKYMNVTKSVPIHVRASKVMNAEVLRLGLENEFPIVNNGDKIKYVFLKKNPTGSDIIAFKDSRMLDEMGLTKYVDKKLLFEKTFVGAAERLTDAIGWKFTKGASLMGSLF